MAAFVIWLTLLARRVFLESMDTVLLMSGARYQLHVAQSCPSVIVGGVSSCAERVDSTENSGYPDSRSPLSLFHFGFSRDASVPNGNAGFRWLMTNCPRRSQEDR